MKIGLSLSRCILDIIEGRVDKDDVLVIISRTDFDITNDTHWENIWVGYTMGGMSYAEWYGHADEEQKFRDLITDLWINGKIHQPRKFGAYVPRRDEYWLEAVLPDSELEKNPAAKKAWDNFKVVASLTNVKLDDKVS